MEFELKVLKNAFSDEICKKGNIPNKQEVLNWLKHKDLIQSNEELLGYEDLTPWSQIGTETFSTVFKIITNIETKSLIAKALVTLNPAKSLVDWTRRRSLLHDNGIPVSYWYWKGDGMIIETYYPKTHVETSNFYELIKIAVILDNLGFLTLSFLNDIRCDILGNPYYIDFGFDLGEPAVNFSFSAKKCLIKAYPSKIGEIEDYYNM